MCVGEQVLDRNHDTGASITQLVVPLRITSLWAHVWTCVGEQVLDRNHVQGVSGGGGGGVRSMQCVIENENPPSESGGKNVNNAFKFQLIT